MLSKQNGKGKNTKVTFTLPSEIQGDSVYVVGDFNNWDHKATPMKRNSDGSFTATVNLERGHEYQFRYLINDDQWENDWEADNYVQNPFGTDNSVVFVQANELT